METRTIGSLEVSVVGLGCNNFGGRMGPEETDAVVGAAVFYGIGWFVQVKVNKKERVEQPAAEAVAV